MWFKACFSLLKACMWEEVIVSFSFPPSTLATLPPLCYNCRFLVLVLGEVKGAEGLKSSYWLQLQCAPNLVEF